MSQPMRPPPLTLSELNRRAIAVLTRELGVADTRRFLNQYTHGSGDYTAEHPAQMGEQTLEQWIEEARRIDQKQNA